MATARALEEKEHVDDDETFSEAGLPADVSTTEFGDAEADNVCLRLVSWKNKGRRVGLKRLT